jgi:hypothetical protein
VPILCHLRYVTCNNSSVVATRRLSLHKLAAPSSQFEDSDEVHETERLGHALSRRHKSIPPTTWLAASKIPRLLAAFGPLPL